jgi:gliding motility-associated-like protein
LCTSRDEFELSHFPNQLELGNDLRFCDKIDTIIGLDNPNFTNIIWNREIPSAKYRVNSPGMLHVSVTNKFGCTERDSINVFLFFSPDLDLGSDTTVCLSENPTLDAGPGMSSYRWGNGAKTRKIKAYDSGIYTVKIINKDGCFTLDSVWVNKRKDLYPSEIYMPNAFTPNGDGINDLYPLNKFQIKGAEYHLRLYNRWGEKLADYKSPDFNWDGNINGTEAPGGVYVYTITWLGCDNRRRSLKGDFTLLR